MAFKGCNMYVIKIEPDGLYWTGDVNNPFTTDKFEAEMFVNKDYTNEIIDTAMILLDGVEES